MESKGRPKMRSGLANCIVIKKGTCLQRIPSSLLVLLYPPALPDTPHNTTSPHTRSFVISHPHYSFWSLAHQQTILTVGMATMC